MSIDTLYKEYCNRVSQTVHRVQQGEPFDAFKADRTYRHILEHVNPEIATNLLQECRKRFNLTDAEMELFILENDKIGHPIKEAVSNWSGILSSPSNFRYIYHSHLILQHLSKLNCLEVDIVEIGGGYGGLCLALSIYARKFGITINTYHFIDLAPITTLQQHYIDYHKPSFSRSFHAADTFGNNVNKSSTPLYLISCYAFTEINKNLQNSYITTLFPKIDHGFVINNGPKGQAEKDFIARFNRDISIEQDFTEPGHALLNTFWFF